ncbi:MAG TPA: hypothetical protein VGQ51_13200 [Puia sp.]|nr:hypothetical protein [Puia sp.]
MKRLIATAYHEAAHAIAALEFQHKFDFVTIIPTTVTGFEILGQVGGLKLAKSISNKLETGLDISMPERVELKHLLIIKLAGGAAEKRLRNLKGFPKSATEDIRSSHQHSLRLFKGNYQLAKSYHENIRKEAINLVGRSDIWGKIESLAYRLMIDRSLRYDDCIRIE